VDAFLSAIATHLPDNVVTNEQLQAENEDWNLARIASKTGIESRHIARETETAGDLAYLAGRKLLDIVAIRPNSIDYLLYCTQSPDYVLPATACVLQHRLGLSKNCAAIDINQGCSGYVYALHLARALVISGSARNVLLLTGETYSKYIHPRDRSVRVLFGDAATGSLISADGPGAKIGDACLGTDGGGAHNLMVGRDGACTANHVNHAEEGAAEGGLVRSAANLYMNGEQLFAFALRQVPNLVQETLVKSGLTTDQVQWFVFHQANAFMNRSLGVRLNIDAARMPTFLKYVGNTVSNTIPLTIVDCHHQFTSGDKVMLVGFGVGYSWGACIITWGPILSA
jgi:3-oxoacyl-[acyl-carrier-protein] synthase III